MVSIRKFIPLTYKIASQLNDGKSGTNLTLQKQLNRKTQRKQKSSMIQSSNPTNHTTELKKFYSIYRFLFTEFIIFFI